MVFWGCLALTWLFQTGEKEALLLMEEVSFTLPGISEQYRRNIWIGRNRIRTDIEDQNISLIYDLRLRTMYVLDHGRGVYFIVLSGRDKSLARTPFLGLTNLEDGKLPRTSPLAVATEDRKKISEWDCRAYRLNYPEHFGVRTLVWSTESKTLLDRNTLRKLWYALVGPEPPHDVAWVVNQLIRELNGVPIRISSTVTQEGLDVTVTSTIVHIQKYENIDPQFFSEPKDYKIAHWDQDARPWTQDQNP